MLFFQMGRFGGETCAVCLIFSQESLIVQSRLETQYYYGNISGLETISCSISYRIYSPIRIKNMFVLQSSWRIMTQPCTLPWSVEAHEELHSFDEHVSNIQREVLQPDEWSYAWGATDFRAQKY